MKSTKIEISLYPYYKKTNDYNVEMRLTRSDSAAEERANAVVRFDIDKLPSPYIDLNEYGKEISRRLFKKKTISDVFKNACRSANSNREPLQIKLSIAAGVGKLHDIIWESLTNPYDPTNNDSFLLTNPNILFSRYLISTDWRAVRLKRKSQLRALVVIANPKDLEKYGFIKIDVKSQLGLFEAALNQIPYKTLASVGEVTLKNLINQLNKGYKQNEEYNILYLICHGMFKNGKTWLWLEKDNGESDRVNGEDLITRFRDLKQNPILIVLASCQSAGNGVANQQNGKNALSALGPRMAAFGIPAVLAMQGNLTLDSLKEFMPTFFSELAKDGQVDQALAKARNKIVDRIDWWMPALFMRLKSGRIWYDTGFSGKNHGLQRWPALITRIINKQCVPIIGPGLTEYFLGSQREIARRWASTYNYPLAPYHQDDLPQVAQYLAVNQDLSFPADEFTNYLRTEMLNRYGKDISQKVRDESKDLWSKRETGQSLNKLISAVGELYRKSNPLEPHKVLAKLSLPIYITTQANDLLADALKAEGKNPYHELCNWHGGLPENNSKTIRRPTSEQPMIYHLFGRLEQKDSLVLTEDNYFDYLVRITKIKETISKVVDRALVDGSLLFIGFHLYDWSFKVLLRGLLDQEGRSRRKRFAHVAVQIDPEDGRILEPEGARQYLEDYFTTVLELPSMSIFWGRAEDFLKELDKRLK